MLVRVIFHEHSGRTANVRHTQIGSGFQAAFRLFLNRAKKPALRWLPVFALAVVCGLGAAATVRAQTQAPAAPTSEPTAQVQPTSSVTALPHFVSRDNLICYVGFEGLDAHSEAWRKTAIFKMLNQTSLGAMLEEVSAQLFDKLLESVPNRKITGAELVSLVKLAAHKGWVLALNGDHRGPDHLLGTLVLRGAAAKDKETKSISSRLLGTLMGPDPKPKIERKDGRVLVVVPTGSAEDAGWVWWPEKDDLVIGFGKPSSADAIISSIDGKSPSAADHAILKQLAEPEAGFVPVMTAILDPAAVPDATKTKLTEHIAQLKSATALNRLEFRWGFEDEAIISVMRLVAPAPRKAGLAVFEQQPLETKNLIPMPEGVQSFVILSMAPAKMLEAFNQLSSAVDIKERIDELIDKVRAQSLIDFEKDFLSNVGPRMAIYLSPNRSAATTDDTPQASVGPTAPDPMAVISTLLGAFPKPTLVAELRDPVVFGKALDAIMISVNKELKGQAMEKAAEEGGRDEAGRAAGSGPGAMPGRGPGRGPGGPEGPGGGRPARKRSLKDTPAPEFRLMPGSVKTYMMSVPSDSPLKILPPGVRPTIRVEGNHIAFASTSEAARTALETIKKNVKPGPDVDQALAHAPAGAVLVAVDDSKETVPGLLASLPGTLQAQINSSITLSASGTPGARAGSTGPGQPPAGPSFGPAASGRNFDQRARMSSGGPGMSGRPGFSGGGGQPGGPGAGQSPGTGVSQDAMIQLKVDADKLPKAEELKALMSPGTLAVAVDDTSIRLVSRHSFPDVVSGLHLGTTFAPRFMPAISAAWAHFLSAASASPAQATSSPEAGNPPGAAQPQVPAGGAMRPGGPQGSGRPGRPGGGRPG
jgi:hypothetical protein